MIAEGVNRASSEARSGAEAMSRVAGVTADARSTAADVKKPRRRRRHRGREPGSGSAAVPDQRAGGLILVPVRRKAESGYAGNLSRLRRNRRDIFTRISHFALLKLSLRIAADAFRHFLADDGWAIASHIALSTLMAMFPFLIVVTALAGFFFGSKELADEAARLLLKLAEAGRGPDRAGHRRRAHRRARRRAHLRRAVCALLRIQRRREPARRPQPRLRRGRAAPWWLLRLESIVYVLVGAVAILAFSFLVVLAPFIWAKLVQYVPTLEPFSEITFARYAVAAACW